MTNESANSDTTDNRKNLLIGRPINRVDGRDKVSGLARYAAEMQLPNIAYGVVIQSTIAKGKIKKIDASAAHALPGVTVFSYANRLPPFSNKGKAKELFLLDDPIVRYSGQIIGLAVADSLEAATHAASLVRITYDAQPANTKLSSNKSRLVTPKSDANSKRGDVSAALKTAPVKIIETYTTPVENHNPMEPFATTVVWKGDSVTIFDSTQAVFEIRDALSEILAMPAEKVRVISKTIGGGFGCKLSVWAHVPIAALAARALNRPLKLVLRRTQMYGPVGFRPSTIQTITMAADKDGKLQAIRHDVISETSTFSEFVEQAAGGTKMSYACANVETSHRIVALDIGSPTWMRAPGHATGSFAIESAMDELAHTLAIDPIELRLRNFAEKDPDSGLPWSSNVLKECYKQGAARFGWHKRNAVPGSREDGGLYTGMGMATSLHTCWRNPASVSVRLSSDGTAIVQSGTQEIGTGTYTVMTQIAAEKLSLPVSRVKFELGDTNMPPGPMSGGSTTATSVGPVVAMASAAALGKLIAVAVADKQSPLYGVPKHLIEADNGCLKSKAQLERGQALKTESFAAVIGRTKAKYIEARVDNKPGDEESKYSMSTFGAQFAEVTVDPELGTLRVSRFVGAYSGGRILNPKTARSQMIGGITFGIGMAMTEQTLTDHNLNRIINSDLAEYHLPVHADMPIMDPFFVEEHDPFINKLGVKGIGELGITGAAAAIANAVYNATGKRIRDLPITLDKLMSDA